MRLARIGPVAPMSTDPRATWPPLPLRRMPIDMRRTLTPISQADIAWLSSWIKIPGKRNTKYRYNAICPLPVSKYPMPCMCFVIHCVSRTRQQNKIRSDQNTLRLFRTSVLRWALLYTRHSR